MDDGKDQVPALTGGGTARFEENEPAGVFDKVR